MVFNKLFANRKLNFWRLRLLVFLAVIGPGIITGTADNDAGGIATYSVMGAHFGYSMLWILLFIILLLYVTQEMGARIGVVTGKGLAAIIREKYGLKLPIFIILLCFIANLSNIIGDMAGVAAVGRIYHFNNYIFIPLSALFIWFIITRGTFNRIQMVFMSSVVLFGAYLINAWIARPDMAAAVRGSVIPTVEFNHAYIYLVMACIGTTITVWGQFFIQSYVVDKRVDIKHLRFVRIDVLTGAFWTYIVAFAIVVSTAATLFVHKIPIKDGNTVALALAPLLGDFAKHLFAWGFLNASLLGASVIAITNSYMISEFFGSESKLDSTQKEAPIFYNCLAFSLIVASIIVLIPKLSLIPLIVFTQVINTMILPFLFFFLLHIANDHKIMGHHKNTRTMNIITIIAIAILGLASLIYLGLMIIT